MLSQLEQQSSETWRRRKQLGVSLEERRLRPAFLLAGEVVAWRCTLCQQLFTIWEGDPESVRKAFERHSCAVRLWREFTKELC